MLPYVPVSSWIANVTLLIPPFASSLSAAPKVSLVLKSGLWPELLHVRLQEVVSERPERFFLAEILREKVFEQYRQEIPYCSTVSPLLKLEPSGCQCCMLPTSKLSAQIPGPRHAPLALQFMVCYEADKQKALGQSFRAYLYPPHDWECLFIGALTEYSACVCASQTIAFISLILPYSAQAMVLLWNVGRLCQSRRDPPTPWLSSVYMLQYRAQVFTSG